MPQNTNFFSKKLISWYLQNKRDLPWRKTKDPYAVWLSEIILQQTRVAQGLPYYNTFITEFPKIKDLANAPEDTVLKLWQGLGYYSRARNLHFSAKFIVKNLNGVFPQTYKDLLQLKGVGDYTASAIASICYGEPRAVVDGNVYRVLSRVFGVEEPINSSAGIKKFKNLAQSLLVKEYPGTYNQAVMEFGARFCVPQNPDCGNCIFNTKCEAFANKKVSMLPVKLKKLKVKTRYFNYLVLIDSEGATFLEQRTKKGIWQQLYQFPLVETEIKATSDTVEKSKLFFKILERYPSAAITLYNETPIIHKLSHQHLHTQFWIVTLTEKIKNSVTVSDIEQFAVPTLISNFILTFDGFRS